MKFTISRIICDCGNEIFWEPMEFEDGDWILICCDKCNKDEGYYIDLVYDFGNRDGLRKPENPN